MMQNQLQPTNRTENVCWSQEIPINWISSGKKVLKASRTGVFPQTKSMPAISEVAVNL